ncbi:MAG: hypothetical protein IJ092_02165, partial [Atopobiaceae bacterium]|nr:hypothetical protein [Atopobiaceae bacterium]
NKMFSLIITTERCSIIKNAYIVTYDFSIVKDAWVNGYCTCERSAKGPFCAEQPAGRRSFQRIDPYAHVRAGI